MKRFSLSVFLLIILVVLLKFDFAFAWTSRGQRDASDKEKVNEAADVATPPAPGVHPVTQAAVNSGILNCVSRINQISKFLTDGMKSGAFLFLPGRDVDRSIFSVSYEVSRQDGSNFYSSASFVPAQDACGAVYDTVEYVEAGCIDVRSGLFGNLKEIGKMENNITMLDAGNVKVFLMPAGKDGCIIIKKEVVR
jgi:hypothetical protein